MTEARIHVGTSGWNYSHWKGVFYPKGVRTEEEFPFYCQNFHTVEINNTFYNLPDSSKVRTWYEAAPEGFVFAVKASRYITHIKKLKDPRGPVDTFTGSLGELKEKLGPILFQLPPSWSCNIERLESFLDALPGGIATRLNFVTRTGSVPRSTGFWRRGTRHFVSTIWRAKLPLAIQRHRGSISVCTDPGTRTRGCIRTRRWPDGPGRSARGNEPARACFAISTTIKTAMLPAMPGVWPAWSNRNRIARQCSLAGLDYPGRIRHDAGPRSLPGNDKVLFHFRKNARSPEPRGNDPVRRER